MNEDPTKRFDDSDDRLNRLIAMVQVMSADVQTVREDVQDVKTRLTSVESRLTTLEQMGADVQDVKTRLISVESRLMGLEQTVEDRLYDTRPMWEGVQVQITGLREEIEKSFRRLGHKVERMGNEVAELYADHRDLEERVTEIEKKMS